MYVALFTRDDQLRRRGLDAKGTRTQPMNLLSLDNARPGQLVEPLTLVGDRLFASQQFGLIHV